VTFVVGEAAAFDGSQGWLGTLLPPFPTGGSPFSVSVRQSLGIASPQVVVEIDDTYQGTYSLQAAADADGHCSISFLTPPGLSGMRFGPRPPVSGTVADTSFWVDWASPPQAAPTLTGLNYGLAGSEFILPIGVLVTPLPPGSDPLPILLTAADYLAIRVAIRADLSENDLPDEVIQTVLSLATQMVMGIDPLAGTWASGSVQSIRVRDAAVLFAASFLVATVPIITRESFLQYSYSIQRPDMSQRAEMLRELAISLLARNLGVSLMSLMRPMAFTLAPGGRGDVSDEPRRGRFPPAWP